jgi:hypothetical protein
VLDHADDASRILFSEIFKWLPPSTPLQQIAVFISHPKGKNTIAGGSIVSIDEFMAEVREEIVAGKIMARDAIPKQYPLLRTIQLTDVGYYRKVEGSHNASIKHEDRMRLIPKGSKPFSLRNRTGSM